MSKKSLKVVSLFSGIGGFEEGLKQANISYEIVFASEIDKYAKISYSANFPDENLFGDITKINEKCIPEHDLLCAGFPCQAFSIAGKRNGFNDTRGTLFFDVARILKEKKPKYIMLENVKNLISHDNSNTIDIILKTLNEIGYTVDFTIINSCESGVPQNRDRTYIVGIYNYKIEKFKEDKRSAKVNSLKKTYNQDEFKGFNFFDTLKFNCKKEYIEDILIDDVDERYFFNSDKIKYFLDINEINDEKEYQNKILKIFDLPKEVHKDLERQRRVYSTKGISPTVLARSDSTKIYIEKGCKKYIRKVTPEENFYIQGFSKEFVDNIKKVNMSNTQMYKQSGNAVSPPVIAEIAKKLYNMEEEENKFKFIDLFSGLGGFRIALESLGGECVFSSDIDKAARETYNMNFEEYPYGDITKIDEKDIPDHDILCAGFPCQPFSIGGKRLGFEDTRGTLFFDVARILKEKKPKAFFLENVSGIMSHDKGNTIETIFSILKNLDYSIEYKTINAKDVGYPQNRNRWYCVGVRNDIVPENTDLEIIFPEKKDLKYTIDDLIDLNASCDYKITDTAKKNIEEHIDKFIKSDRFNKEHPIIANEIRKSRCNFRSDGISPCLTAKMGTGGNNIPVLVDKNRKLTERECLRIMGFPENYKIKMNNYQSYKQIGNSVVVPIIRDIGKELVKIINK